MLLVNDVEAFGLLKEKYGTNVPIYVEDLDTEQLRELHILESSNEIKRFDLGVYYFPEKYAFGDSIINSRPVIVRKYITDGVEVYGYTAGLSLENLAGVSTQIPRMWTITTNNALEDSFIDTIGHSKVKLQRSPTEITKYNVSALQFLELLSHTDPDQLEVYERLQLMQFQAKLNPSYELMKQYYGLYPNAIDNAGKVGIYL